MAEAEVEFLLDNLNLLRLYHTDLIESAMGQIEELVNDLRLFRAFLYDSIKLRRKDDYFREFARQIRDVVYEVNDTVDTFVSQIAMAKDTRNNVQRVIQTPVDLLGIASRVKAVRRKVMEIYGDKNQLDLAFNLTIRGGDGAPCEKPEAPLVSENCVVGFEDETSKIIGYLLEETRQLEVISIVGMPGLGKTTLAMKIFNDKTIQYEFPTRIWVHVSREFTRKDVYLTILRKLNNNNITEDMCRRNDEDLAEIIHKRLENGKFLLVMDDMWTTQDWDQIQVALPKMSGAVKVLITSRCREVAEYANWRRAPYCLRTLTSEESWLLLRYEIFGKPECPHDLEVPGMLIATQCDGLPLAIVIIGGILMKKISTSEDMNAKREALLKVSNSVTTYLYMDTGQRMENIISLSYDKLPDDLKTCFLYLGMFPRDFEIPVWKLIWMWIAEGFIQHRAGISLEEVAENYLYELINRNLVRAAKRRFNGKVKTCRIDNVLHDFCKRKARVEENFLQEIEGTSEGFETQVTTMDKYRRICIHSNIMKFLSLKPFGPHVRSLVCFSKESTTLPPENSAAIPAGFKLLRVLDIKPIKFARIPSDMFQLLHLRYITLSFKLAILPAAFAKLWKIETLIIDTSSPTLEIKADIWKMSQLRHLKMNAPAHLPTTEEGSKEGEKLQTLGTISPQSCTEKAFERAHNLKKLGIRGQLALLLDGKTVLFNNLVKLTALEKLKLLNDASHSPVAEFKLRSLPPPYQFPPNLKSLTLSSTFLDWRHMSTLGILENLEVLKLKERAFMGLIWEAKDGGFRNLEVLHIGRTDLKIWKASDHHYPRLKLLELHNCEELREIPYGLADIPNFQMLDLYFSNNAATSAIKIHSARKNIVESKFKLSIFPLPIHT